MKIYTRKMMMTRMNFYEERERETAKAWQKHKKKNEWDDIHEMKDKYCEDFEEMIPLWNVMKNNNNMGNKFHQTARIIKGKKKKSKWRGRRRQKSEVKKKEKLI